MRLYSSVDLTGNVNMIETLKRKFVSIIENHQDHCPEFSKF